MMITDPTILLRRLAVFTFVICITTTTSSSNGIMGVEAIRDNSVVAQRFHDKSDSDCSFFGVVAAQKTNVCHRVDRSLARDDRANFHIEYYGADDCQSGSLLEAETIERQYDLCANFELQQDMEEYNNPHLLFTYHTSWSDLQDEIVPGTYAVQNWYDTRLFDIEDIFSSSSSTRNGDDPNCPEGHEVAKNYFKLDTCLLGREAVYELLENTVSLMECDGRGRDPLVYPVQECTLSESDGVFSKWIIEEIKYKTGGEEFKEDISNIWDDHKGIIIGVIVGVVALCIIGWVLAAVMC